MAVRSQVSCGSLSHIHTYMYIHVDTCTMCQHMRDLKFYSPGGVGGCGCGSEKGELCELTRGAAAVGEREGSKE